MVLEREPDALAFRQLERFVQRLLDLTDHPAGRLLERRHEFFEHAVGGDDVAERPVDDRQLHAKRRNLHTGIFQIFDEAAECTNEIRGRK